MSYLCTQKTSRGGAVVARWAHNPKVVGSNPAPATKESSLSRNSFFFFTPFILMSAESGLKED